MILRKYLFQTMAVLIAATAWTGCDKDDDDVQEVRYTVSGNGSGNQEVPAVTTTGTSTVAGTYNASGKVLTYTVNWNNLLTAPTMMHFHGPADPGANAGIMIPIEGFPATVTGTYSGIDTLTVDQESALLNGKMYYNVHTTTNPTGEVRAQLGVTRQ